MLAPFDLWSLDAGNRILESDNEALVRSVVRELLESGYLAENLSLGLPDNVTVLEGAALAAWVEG
jgi:hypothetical protein